MHNAITSKIQHSSTIWNISSTGRSQNLRNSWNILSAYTSLNCFKVKNSEERLCSRLAVNSSTTKQFCSGNTTLADEQKLSISSTYFTIHPEILQVYKIRMETLKNWIDMDQHVTNLNKLKLSQEMYSEFISFINFHFQNHLPVGWSLMIFTYWNNNQVSSNNLLFFLRNQIFQFYQKLLKTFHHVQGENFANCENYSIFIFNNSHLSGVPKLNENWINLESPEWKHFTTPPFTSDDHKFRQVFDQRKKCG